jgi:hypothetical protein
MIKIKTSSIDSETLDNEVPIYSPLTGMYQYQDGLQPRCGGISLDKFIQDVSFKGLYTREQEIE